MEVKTIYSQPRHNRVDCADHLRIGEVTRDTMPKQRDTTKRGRGRSATTGAASRGLPGRKRRPDTVAERSDSSRRGRKPGRGPNPAIRQAEAESEGPPPQVSSSAASSQPNEAPVAGEQLEQGVPGEFFFLFVFCFWHGLYLQGTIHQRAGVKGLLIRIWSARFPSLSLTGSPSPLLCY